MQFVFPSSFLQPHPEQNMFQARSELQSTEILEIERTKTPIQISIIEILDNGLNITRKNL